MLISWREQKLHEARRRVADLLLILKRKSWRPRFEDAALLAFRPFAKAVAGAVRKKVHFHAKEFAPERYVDEPFHQPIFHHVKAPKPAAGWKHIEAG